MLGLLAGSGTLLSVAGLVQGELEITAEPREGQAAPAALRTPFLMLGLDLPPAPLYKDALERNIIPQVSILDQGGANSAWEICIGHGLKGLPVAPTKNPNVKRTLGHSLWKRSMRSGLQL